MTIRLYFDEDSMRHALIHVEFLSAWGEKG